jgi:hypothetical protein
MGFPLVPVPTPVLLVALPPGPLFQAAWSGRLPNVNAGEAFWASSLDAPDLVAAGLAELAPPDTVAPPVEPKWCAHGTAGFGAGTSNCTH